MAALHEHGKKKQKQLTPLARSQNSHYDLSTSHFIIRIHESCIKEREKRKRVKGKKLFLKTCNFLVTVSKRRKTGRLNLI